MTDELVHQKLDVLTCSFMEARGETGRARSSIVRTQWLTCAICILAVLVAAASIFRSVPA